MSNNAAARTTKLRETAAEIVKAAGGADFILHKRPGQAAVLQKELFDAIYEQLMVEGECNPRTARKYIFEALGLTRPPRNPIPLPVQTITFRATKAEEEAIRPAARAKINALLAEVRAKTKDG